MPTAGTLFLLFFLGWTRACVLFCNTWHIACHYSLSWWTSLVCLSLVDMKKMQVLMWCRIWFFQQPSCVLLCLFLNEVSWQATRKVVQCWTKCQTYCCAKHLFRLKRHDHEYSKNPSAYPTVASSTWQGALGSTPWCNMIVTWQNHEHLGTMRPQNVSKIVCTCLWRWFLLVCLPAGPVAYARLASWVYCWIYVMLSNGCIMTEMSKDLP